MLWLLLCVMSLYRNFQDQPTTFTCFFLTLHIRGEILKLLCELCCFFFIDYFFDDNYNNCTFKCWCDNESFYEVLLLKMSWTEVCVSRILWQVWQRPWTEKTSTLFDEHFWIKLGAKYIRTVVVEVNQQTWRLLCWNLLR